MGVLREMVQRNVPYGDVYMLLGTIFIDRGRTGEAARVYRSARDNGNLPQPERESVRMLLRQVEQWF
jgi:Flp pilus assembly protein TadD